jgi:hypothetical protein
MHRRVGHQKLTIQEVNIDPHLYRQDSPVLSQTFTSTKPLVGAQGRSLVAVRKLQWEEALR